MAFSFMVKIKDQAALETKIQKFIDAKGGSFSPKFQQFSGSGFEGVYRLNGFSATITITKKPWVIPESVVKNQITKFIEADA